MNPTISTIIEAFNSRGTEAYGSEAVNQLDHALQCASLAVDHDAAPPLVTAALLHDIGHILGEDVLPADDSTNLDDGHERRAHPWLLGHFGPAVADPVRLHVAAKRYLCTVDPHYISALSPTSRKSYLDQGGTMSEAERAAFEAESHFRDAVTLRRWDDLAKVPGLETPHVHYFVPYLTRSLLR